MSDQAPAAAPSREELVAAFVNKYKDKKLHGVEFKDALRRAFLEKASKSTEKWAPDAIIVVGGQVEDKELGRKPLTPFAFQFKEKPTGGNDDAMNDGDEDEDGDMSRGKGKGKGKGKAKAEPEHEPEPESEASNDETDPQSPETKTSNRKAPPTSLDLDVPGSTAANEFERRQAPLSAATPAPRPAPSPPAPRPLGAPTHYVAIPMTAVNLLRPDRAGVFNMKTLEDEINLSQPLICEGKMAPVQLFPLPVATLTTKEGPLNKVLPMPLTRAQHAVANGPSPPSLFSAGTEKLAEDLHRERVAMSRREHTGAQGETCQPRLLLVDRVIRALRTGKLHSGKVDLIGRLSAYPGIVRKVGEFLDADAHLRLYSISVDWHKAANTYMRHNLERWAACLAPTASTVFPWRLWRYRDYGFFVLDPLGRTLLSPLTPTAPTDASTTQRRVPTMKWLQMVAQREDMATDILACLARQGLLCPPGTRASLLKMWLVMDVDTNAGRDLVIGDRERVTDADLYNMQLFLCKLQLLFSDPMFGPANMLLLDLFLGQKSLIVLHAALLGRKYRSAPELLHLKLRYDFGHGWTLPYSVGERGKPVFGVAPKELGRFHLEHFGNGTSAAHLVSPVDLVPKEAARRRLRLDTHLFPMLRYGFVDDATGRNIVPDADQLRLGCINRPPRATEERKTRSLDTARDMDAFVWNRAHLDELPAAEQKRTALVEQVRANAIDVAHDHKYHVPGHADDVNKERSAFLRQLDADAAGRDPDDPRVRYDGDGRRIAPDANPNALPDTSIFPICEDLRVQLPLAAARANARAVLYQKNINHAQAQVKALEGGRFNLGGLGLASHEQVLALRAAAPGPLVSVPIVVPDRRASSSSHGSMQYRSLPQVVPKLAMSQALPYPLVLSQPDGPPVPVNPLSELDQMRMWDEVRYPVLVGVGEPPADGAGAAVAATAAAAVGGVQNGGHYQGPLFDFNATVEVHEDLDPESDDDGGVFEDQSDEETAGLEQAALEQDRREHDGSAAGLELNIKGEGSSERDNLTTPLDQSKQGEETSQHDNLAAGAEQSETSGTNPENTDLAAGLEQSNKVEKSAEHESLTTGLHQSNNHEESSDHTSLAAVAEQKNKGDHEISAASSTPERDQKVEDSSEYDEGSAAGLKQDDKGEQGNNHDSSAATLEQEKGDESVGHESSPGLQQDNKVEQGNNDSSAATLEQEKGEESAGHQSSPAVE